MLQAQFECLSAQLKQLSAKPVLQQPVLRIELPLPFIHLQGFLAQQHCNEKALWRDRDGDYTMAVLGYSWSQALYCPQDANSAFANARNLLKHLPDRAHCLCYLSFDDSERSIWPAFGYGRVFLPLLELIQTRKNTTLAINLYAVNGQTLQHSIKKAQNIITSLNDNQNIPASDYRLTRQSLTPNYPAWQRIVTHAKQRFGTSALHKVVLSREARFLLLGKFSPWTLLHPWLQANPRCYQFFFQAGNEMFFGCSPERLVKRLENTIATEALAGTIIRGQDKNEDQHLETVLMNDSKNIHENRLVLEDICLQLQPLCRSLNADRNHSVVKLKRVQHLRYQIRGVLHDGVHDEQLLQQLHPTPAVGGSPRDLSLSFIRNNEPYARGLYAGACGRLGIRSSNFSVAIRSARLVNDCLLLYSGAGTVENSVAQDEWVELDNKIATLLAILTRE